MNDTRKWIIHRVSAIILAPLFIWFYFSLISLSEKNYQEATKVAEAKAKPDFLDMDKDGNKKEPMKKAIKDKEAK